MLEFAKYRTKSKIDVEPYLRFTLWTDKPIGEYMVNIFEMPSELFYEIKEVIPHSENGIDVDYEEIKSIQQGFIKDNVKEILKILENGEDGFICGRYIKILSARYPMRKKWNPKYTECTEQWLKDGGFQDLLKKIGKADFKQVMNELDNGKVITWRYIIQATYRDSVTKCGFQTKYIQLFSDNENIGWCERHPHRDYQKLDDGRIVAIGEPTIYYDCLLANNTKRLWKSLYCWIKE